MFTQTRTAAGYLVTCTRCHASEHGGAITVRRFKLEHQCPRRAAA